MKDKYFMDGGRVVAKLVIEIIRHIAVDSLGTDQYAAAPDIVLIILGIWVGHTEGRPMTAAKLAQFIGMSRPTVCRKLKQMQRRGMITDIGGGRWIRAIDDPEKRAIIFSHIASVIEIIHRASRELSKMDMTN